LKSRMGDGVPALDVRPGDQFADAHVPGSINIPLSGQFATWAATVLGLFSRPLLIAETEPQIEEARMRLARVGIEDVSGHLAGGIEAWKQAGSSVAAVPQLTAEELQARLASNGVRVLDVRREGEWQAGHVAGAQWWPLDKFRAALPPIDPRAPLAVHCKSGYRSMIACSLLQRAGYENVINVTGGFDAWQNAKLPIETNLPAKVQDDSPSAITSV
jgi:hydroxyacylglutathione hydrolase